MNARAADFVLHSVSDIGESVSFYRDTLGLELESLDEDTGWAEFALPPTTLALCEVTPVVPLEPGAGGVAVSLAVEDVEASVEELREQGMDVPMEPEAFPTCDMAVVTDPDENPVVLHKRSDGTCGRRDPFP